jgi:hypothetical protein
MSNRQGGANTRASKYDYLIKLLLIGDSGKLNYYTFRYAVFLKLKIFKH